MSACTSPVQTHRTFVQRSKHLASDKSTHENSTLFTSQSTSTLRASDDKINELTDNDKKIDNLIKILKREFKNSQKNLSDICEIFLEVNQNLEVKPIRTIITYHVIIARLILIENKDKDSKNLVINHLSEKFLEYLPCKKDKMKVFLREYFQNSLEISYNIFSEEKLLSILGNHYVFQSFQEFLDKNLDEIMSDIKYQLKKYLDDSNNLSVKINDTLTNNLFKFKKNIQFKSREDTLDKVMVYIPLCLIPMYMLYTCVERVINYEQYQPNFLEQITDKISDKIQSIIFSLRGRQLEDSTLLELKKESIRNVDIPCMIIELFASLLLFYFSYEKIRAQRQISKYIYHNSTNRTSLGLLIERILYAEPNLNSISHNFDKVFQTLLDEINVNIKPIEFGSSKESNSLQTELKVNPVEEIKTIFVQQPQVSLEQINQNFHDKTVVRDETKVKVKTTPKNTLLNSSKPNELNALKKNISDLVEEFKIIDALPQEGIERPLFISEQNYCLFTIERRTRSVVSYSYISPKILYKIPQDERKIFKTSAAKMARSEHDNGIKQLLQSHSFICPIRKISIQCDHEIKIYGFSKRLFGHKVNLPSDKRLTLINFFHYGEALHKK